MGWNLPPQKPKNQQVSAVFHHFSREFLPISVAFMTSSGLIQAVKPFL
jgi:hypothetical protein